VTPRIHPTAEVEPESVIGAGTSVWHLCHIRAGAVVGSDCTLGRNVFVDSGVQIGDRCKIQNNVSVYRGVTLEDGVFVGPSAVFTNDRTPRAEGDWSITPTVVRRGASIGAGAIIVCGVEIGEGALVGAGAVVTRDVEPWTKVVGNPARVIGRVDAHGRPAEAVTP
jgi:acetyltransferase-like isoleucine patch superfamily enzyme